jgi:hypothetical protein
MYRTPRWPGRGPRRNRRKIYGKPINACFTIEKSLTKTELIALTTTGTTAIDVRLSDASSRMMAKNPVPFDLIGVLVFRHLQAHSTPG